MHRHSSQNCVLTLPIDPPTRGSRRPVVVKVVRVNAQALVAVLRPDVAACDAAGATIAAIVVTICVVVVVVAIAVSLPIDPPTRGSRRPVVVKVTAIATQALVAELRP